MSDHVNRPGIVLVNGGRAWHLAYAMLSAIRLRTAPSTSLCITMPSRKMKIRLVLTKKAGDMKLFLYDLDDLHQLDFIHNQQMAKEIERLRVLSTTTVQQRESWKVRAFMAETQLLETTAKTSNNGGRQNVSDVRYASL